MLKLGSAEGKHEGKAAFKASAVLSGTSVTHGRLVDPSLLWHELQL